MIKLNEDVFLLYLQDKLKDKTILQNSDFFKALANYCGLEFVDLNKIKNIENYFNIIPYSLMKEHRFFCFNCDDKNLYLATLKPLDDYVIDRIQNLFRTKNIIVNISSFLEFSYFFERNDFLYLLDKFSYDLEKNLKSQELKDNNSLEELLLLFLRYANTLRASDIHFEPLEHEVVIRFRIDGVLKYIVSLKYIIFNALLSHIKIISLLNIAENKISQDGSFTKNIKGEQYDFRISIMPLIYAESIVIRILKQNENSFKLDQLYIAKNNLDNIRTNFNSSFGLCLFCGPTGSGKSTFMHTILDNINDGRKIITLEDPVEYKLKNAQQILLNPKIGFDFNKALRGILRQDPDVVMVGEIRDEESLDIVLKASLTGHLVLSTLHTNNAIEAIFRMIHMNAKIYLIASSLKFIVAQRLVRKLCDCKQEYESKQYDFKIFKAKGCAKCMMSGYKGRLMVAEYLFINQEIKSMIEKNAGFSEILACAIKHGFSPLKNDALQKVKMGLTSLEELERVVY